MLYIQSGKFASTIICDNPNIYHLIKNFSASPFAIKSAFSPLCQTNAFGARYPYLQHASPQMKRFLSAPFSGTGFLSTVLQDHDQPDTSNGESQD